MVTKQSHTTARRITLESVEGHRLLVQEITIACPDCGTVTLQLMGHHLRALHDILGETLAAEPDLCGEAAERTGQTEFRVDVDDARKAGLN